MNANMRPKLVEVKALPGYRLWLRYSDGVEGIVDLSDRVGKGVFAAWLDESTFQKVTIGPGGEVAWGEALDLCPDALYLQLTGKKPEDIFPKLHELAATHA